MSNRYATRQIWHSGLAVSHSFRVLGILAAVRQAAIQPLETTESFAWTTGVFEEEDKMWSSRGKILTVWNVQQALW